MAGDDDVLPPAPDPGGGNALPDEDEVPEPNQPGEGASDTPAHLRDIERVMECVHSLLVSVRVCAPIQTPPRVWSFCPSFGGTYTRCCNNATI